MENKRLKIQFTHIRHATSMLEINGIKILIDPMLAAKETLPPVVLTDNKYRNPRVNLPVNPNEILNCIDYILLTHTHFDHFDKEAMNQISKEVPIIVSPGNAKKLRRLGFTNCIPVQNPFNLNIIAITRFKAIHGRRLLRLLLGKGSSYSLSVNELNIFITGDSIWNKNLKSIIIGNKPDIIIANGGAARFRFGKPITLSIQDIKEIAELLPMTQIIVVHLDSLNHCTESREYYKKYFVEKRNILIPNDGEVLQLIK